VKNFKRKVKRCPEFLSTSEIEKIHVQSLNILKNTGIEVNHVEALKLLEKEGAEVDFQAQRVKIPEELVQRCLDTLPDRCILAARDPEKDCILEPDGRPFSTDGGG